MYIILWLHYPKPDSNQMLVGFSQLTRSSSKSSFYLFTHTQAMPPCWHVLPYMRPLSSFIFSRNSALIWLFGWLNPGREIKCSRKCKQAIHFRENSFTSIHSIHFIFLFFISQPSKCKQERTRKVNNMVSFSFDSFHNRFFPFLPQLRENSFISAHSVWANCNLFTIQTAALPKAKRLGYNHIKQTYKCILERLIEIIEPFPDIAFWLHFTCFSGSRL